MGSLFELEILGSFGMHILAYPPFPQRTRKEWGTPLLCVIQRSPGMGGPPSITVSALSRDT